MKVVFFHLSAKEALEYCELVWNILCVDITW